MGQPRKLDKYEAAAVLTPLVWPLVQDKAKVTGPVGGNPVTSGVHISCSKGIATLTTEQYELFRTGVLLYFVDAYLYTSRMRVLEFEGLDTVARDRILEVFEGQ